VTCKCRHGPSPLWIHILLDKGRRSRSAARIGTIDAHPYVLRELMPSEDKLDLTAWRRATTELEFLAHDLGFLLAWSELRSGGRDGSATIDELGAFAHRGKWRRSIVDFAGHYEDVAWRDWKRFRAAYRDGVFRPRARNLTP
jgi:uncharacterized protein (DUF2252 family)